MPPFPPARVLPAGVAGGPVPDVRRVGVLRANAIGDFVFALPALEALRAAYPQAEVVLLGLGWHEAFLRGRAGPVDRVLAAPHFPPKRRDPAFAAFLEAARQERFDLAVQMHGGGMESNPVVLAMGARVTAGLRTTSAAPLDRWAPYVYFQNEVLRCLEVAALAGARPVTVVPRLEPTERDRAEAARVVPPGEAPLAVLHPGAGDPRRRWPAARFRDVGRALMREGVRVVVTGSGGDARLTAAAATQGAEDLGGRLGLGGLLALLSRADVVVSNDSGPLHLARAAGAPTVGVYWCGNAVNAGPVECSRHRIAMSWRTRCPACGSDCMAEGCRHRRSFVADVPVGEVLSSALELLGVAADGAGSLDHVLGGK